MKKGEAENKLRERLLEIYPLSESAAIADLAFGHLTGQDRTARSLGRDEVLTPEQETVLASITKRLLRHEPVQYVCNRAYFYGLELYVDRAVLIPRPETEELVDWILKDVQHAGIPVFQKGGTDADRTSMLKVLDLGTGSGCIALALKNKMPLAEVWGCDISDQALNVARRNGADTNIRVDFQGIDFLDEAQQRLLPSVDIIVSNPPYVPVRDKNSMSENVLQWEPHGALFVPDNDPLLFYRAIVGFAKKRLHEGGSIYLEIHEDLGADVRALFSAEGYKTVEIRKDMQGKDRMVKVMG